MKAKSSSIPASNATVDDKIAFIQKLARLDPSSAARNAADFPESLFQESPVGRGYNIFGAFADNASVQGAVLDFAKMKNDGLITSTPINDSDTLIVAGETMQQVSESMSASVSASGGASFGAASFAGSRSSTSSAPTSSPMRCTEHASSTARPPTPGPTRPRPAPRSRSKCRSRR